MTVIVSRRAITLQRPGYTRGCSLPLR